MGAGTGVVPNASSGVPTTSRKPFCMLARVLLDVPPFLHLHCEVKEPLNNSNYHLNLSAWWKITLVAFSVPGWGLV